MCDLRTLKRQTVYNDATMKSPVLERLGSSFATFMFPGRAELRVPVWRLAIWPRGKENWRETLCGLGEGHLKGGDLGAPRICAGIGAQAEPRPEARAGHARAERLMTSEARPERGVSPGCA